MNRENELYEPEYPYHDTDGHLFCEKCKPKGTGRHLFSYECSEDTCFTFCYNCGKQLFGLLADWKDLDPQMRGRIFKSLKNKKKRNKDEEWSYQYLLDKKSDKKI